MPNQFQQPNINSAIPRGAKAIDASYRANPDDDLLIANASASPVIIELYSASGVPGNTLIIKAPFGGINPVDVFPLPGELIDGLPSTSLLQNQESIVLKSDGKDWLIVARFSLGSGGIIGGQNVGSPPGTGLIYRNEFGGIIFIRSLVGINGATVTTVGDNVIIDGGGGASPIQSSSFLDNSTLDIPVGSLLLDGQILVDMSLFDTALGITQALQWIFAVDSSGVSADIVQVDSSSSLNVLPSATDVGANAVCRLTGTGSGNLIEVRYRVNSIPRL
jgi:hypothetical protein